MERLVAEARRNNQPAYIIVPSDYALSPVTLAKVEPLALKSNEASLKSAVEAVTERLKTAKSIVALPAFTIARLGLQEQARKAIEALGCPFATTSMEKCIIDESHPQFAGLYGGAASAEETRQIVEGGARQQIRRLHRNCRRTNGHAPGPRVRAWPLESFVWGYAIVRTPSVLVVMAAVARLGARGVAPFCSCVGRLEGWLRRARVVGLLFEASRIAPLIGCGRLDAFLYASCAKRPLLVNLSLTISSSLLVLIDLRRNRLAGRLTQREPAPTLAK